MMKLVFSRDWRTFFGDDPYPFDLAMVEERDGDDGRALFASTVLGTTPKRVIDLGCGNGRHMVALAANGHTVYGVDLCRRAVARANQRLSSRTAVVASIEALPFSDATFDAAVCFYTSFGYTGTSSARVFSEAARVVCPGGLLIIDVSNGERYPLSVGVERLPGGLGLWFRYGTFEQVRQRNLVVSARVLGVYGFSHRRYTGAGLANEVAADGSWAPRALYGDFDSSAVSALSQRIVMVACRKG